MVRKPYFWILFIAVSVLSGGLAARYFSDAFPVVSLDLSMDRQAALDAAREMAEEHGWGPADYRQAASFELDQNTRNLVELEGGGNEAFKSMLADGLYAPYKWRVRHFSEGETRETAILFTPQGEPYGFHQKLPEDEPGPSLSAEQAEAIAEDAARKSWGIDLSAYERIEQGQETRPGGRTDHTLVYQRPGLEIAEGRYRLRLVVGGDQLTQLWHFVFVPEAFERRYEEMRSGNQVISVGGMIGMILLLVGGGVGGLFYLLRQHWVLWRPAVAWGLFVAFLQALVILNQWPMSWMSYDTAVSTQNFVLQQSAFVVAAFFGSAVLYCLSFMAAESLSRRAFPGHLQLWKAWSPEAAGSTPLLGYTAAAYLLIALMFAYEVGLYFFSSRVLGWWSPSSAHVDPNVLATYQPWLTSIAVSLQAGFWEECLFRAVPIAGAALLGKRFGHQKTWIVAALVLQAVIFAAGHANYPAQPSYARLVELILPAMAWGLIYLSFGLIPVIVMHFAYDVIWFSIPVFVSQADNAWVNQAMVILLALIPVWIVVYGRLRAGRWTALPDRLRNGAWSPPVIEAATEPVFVPAPTGGLSDGVRKSVFAAGLVGLILWGALQDFQRDAPPLQGNRKQAVATAREMLADRSLELNEPWQALPAVSANISDSHRFAWQEGGEEAYRELLGSYLPAPRWRVRFARFEGDVAERAEEFRVTIDAGGSAVRMRHQLAEAKGGATLAEDEARTMALAAVKTSYGYESTGLEEVSAKPSSLPDRTDWEFEFKRERGYPLQSGEPRIGVFIAGDELADTYRYLHLPEDWVRQQQDRQTRIGAVSVVSGVVLTLLFLAALIKAIVNWSKRKQFAVRTFLVFFGGLAVVTLIKLFNRYPDVVAGFSTAQPLKTQVLMFLIGGGIFGLLLAVVIGILCGFVQTWIRKDSSLNQNQSLALGISLGLFTSGIIQLAAVMAPSLEPSWGNYAAAGTYAPMLDIVAGKLNTLVLRAVMLLLIFGAMEKLTRHWTCRKPLAILAFSLLGLTLAGTAADAGLGQWITAGLVTGGLMLVAYATVLRHGLAMLPIVVGTIRTLSIIRGGLWQNHALAMPGAALSAVLVVLVSFYWWRHLQQGDTGPAT